MNNIIRYGFFTDSRDSKTYNTVNINGQVWMTENLNYNPSSGISACYGNDFSNCILYGRLYDWETAKMVCPDGWHLPSDAEWDALMAAVGGSSTAGTKLKAEIGWSSRGNGTDNYGFSAFPGGNGGFGNVFYLAGYLGYWWSASEYNSGNAYCRYMGYDISNVYRFDVDKSNLLSVRYVRD